MTTLATRARELAAKLITKYGNDATFTLLGDRTYSTDGTVSSDPPTGVTVKAAPSSALARTFGGIAGTPRIGDTEVVVAGSGLTFTPELHQPVSYLAKSWKVSFVRRVEIQDGGPIVWLLSLEGGA